MRKRNEKIIKQLIPYISLFVCMIFIYLAYTSVVEKGAWIEEYLTEQAKKTTYFTQSPISQKLQENEYFLMGDNRKISFDSRSFGVIKREQILYKQAEGVTKLFWRNTIMFVGVMIAAFILYGVLNVVFFELIRLQRRRCLVKCTKRSLDKNRT